MGPVRVHSHRAKDEPKAKKIKDQAQKIKEKNDKRQRKLLRSPPPKFGVNEP